MAVLCVAAAERGGLIKKEERRKVWQRLLRPFDIPVGRPKRIAQREMFLNFLLQTEHQNDVFVEF